MVALRSGRAGVHQRAPFDHHPCGGELDPLRPAGGGPPRQPRQEQRLKLQLLQQQKLGGGLGPFGVATRRQDPREAGPHPPLRRRYLGPGDHLPRRGSQCGLPGRYLQRRNRQHHHRPVPRQGAALAVPRTVQLLGRAALGRGTLRRHRPHERAWSDGLRLHQLQPNPAQVQLPGRLLSRLHHLRRRHPSGPGPEDLLLLQRRFVRHLLGGRRIHRRPDHLYPLQHRRAPGPGLHHPSRPQLRALGAGRPDHHPPRGQPDLLPTPGRRPLGPSRPLRDPRPAPLRAACGPLLHLRHGPQLRARVPLQRLRRNAGVRWQVAPAARG